MFWTICRGFTLNAADKSSRISTEDLAVALASFKAAVTANRAVSVEWLLLNPDWFGSRKLFCERYSVTCLNIYIYILGCRMFHFKMSKTETHTTQHYTVQEHTQI